MNIGPLQFDRPLWLVLAPALWTLSWLIARRSLAGLGDRLRWVVLGVRCGVFLLIAAALAEPHWRRESRWISLLAIADESASMPPGSREAILRTIREGCAEARHDDRLGVVTAAEKGLAQILPSDKRPAQNAAVDVRPDQWVVGGREGTDLAASVRMALAIKPEDTAARILLASDGNETAGSLLAAAASAKAAGIPIDVLPVAYAPDREVIFDSLVTPTTARRGQTARIRMVLTSTGRSSGRLSLKVNGEVVDIDPESPGDSIEQSLEPGRNVVTVPVVLDRSGPQVFEAVFEPSTSSDDAVGQNNRAMGVTFVSGQGRIALYADSAEAALPIQNALEGSRLEVEARPFSAMFQSLTELQGFDAVVLIDAPSAAFSDQQLKELHAYVHDSGGGLIVVGGPNSFGAGGWMNTPLADALPVKLDPPQKRQMPRGALAVVMHSCEIPEGNYWGQQTALAAAQSLSRLDLFGLLEYGWQGAGADGVTWTYPMAEVGDGSGVARAIKNLQFGDMPDFAPLMRAAMKALKEANAAQRHCILISDGDPAAPSPQLVQDFIDAGITVSTLEVFPHGSVFGSTMRSIAQATGGQYYQISNRTQLATLPRILIKEARIVRRSLIWEGSPVTPTLLNVGAETTRGIVGPLPAITGYVVTAQREGLAQVTISGPEGDPIAAQWQYGLGRTVAFTSDSASRWCSQWLGWGQFRAFWDQHVRWAMRPSGSANVSVVTETRSGETRVVSTAIDASGEAMNFAQFRGRIVGPDLKSQDIELRQTGPGRYEGTFPTTQSGSYLVNLRYDAPKRGGSGVESGTVQAAVTRPFADEHRALRDNSPLLRQVADMTGGRVLSPTGPGQAPVSLFTRDGLSFPVALTPIWLLVMTIAAGGFLLDVAVRRVRIEPAMLLRAIRRATGRGHAASAGRADELKLARERAKARSESPAQETRGTDIRATKFEAQEGSTAASPVAQATTDAALGGPADSRPKAAKNDEKEQGMSRLLKAKKRARGETDRENPGA